MLLVNINVLVDKLQDDPEQADWSIRQLQPQTILRSRTCLPSLEVVAP
jgi:hypothetical protein